MNQDEAWPSCSSKLPNVVEPSTSDITKLSLEHGVNVWGLNQTTLEEQALHEIDLFASETQPEDKNQQLEDGEIIDDNETTEKANKQPQISLNINSYIKRQEELRKFQDHRKSIQSDVISAKSKDAANKISIMQKKPQKRARKKSESKGPINESSKRIKKEADLQKPKLKIPDSDSDYVPSDDELEDDSELSKNPCPNSIKSKFYSCPKSQKSIPVSKLMDDGCIKLFQNRLEQYYNKLELDEDEDTDELEYKYYTIKGGLKIPFKIWNRLYGYQQDGVRWLWEIHNKSTGGILGDEMGLGKTVQIIAFLAAIEYSKIVTDHGRFKGLGSTIIVAPVTVIHQWVKHFHEWAPELRVAILHQSGSYQGHKNDLVKEIHKANGVIVTSYSGVLKYKNHLIEHTWHYLILDEGHKIRNSSAKVSVAVKQIRTPHRLMLTGSPMQNNLQELWSLFDFTNPDMLGNIATFMEHFNNPIVQGGFANATPIQQVTALSVATTLKNVITPFLLRRTKNEVQDHISLPDKTEQVLFCTLSEEQRDLYKGYLMSDHIGTILTRDNNKTWFSENQSRANVLVAITTLRKICNHPDIYLFDAAEHEHENSNIPLEEQFGYYKKSGKLIVVSALLKMWKKQNHRTLLFTQSRSMITIFEIFLSQQGYKHLKMDGTTSVTARQPLIDKFNQDTSFDVFLLTTRVGGLGVNLTGADRVIIYDPDWNPATDTQARERAWRIGQDKQVTIYRLLSAGTIEEKMYQRQVWKQLLSNKVLLDPKTQQFFKSSNLHDLFSLPPDEQKESESTNIFRESRVKLQEKIKEKEKSKLKGRPVTTQSDAVLFSDDKIQAMKNLAQQIAKSLSSSSSNDNIKEPQPQKSSYQIELEEERQNKLKEKEKLKKLTPMELVHFNRKRAEKRDEDDDTNKVDGYDTSTSFTKALEYSAENAAFYATLKEKDKIKNVSVAKIDKHKAHREKTTIDNSGVIDGEKVDGLIRSEVKKIRDKKKVKLNDSEGSSMCQDQYILDKLFSKKGVSGALQHDSIIENSVKQSLKVQSEAKERADKSLEALRKSRLNNWRW